MHFRCFFLRSSGVQVDVILKMWKVKVPQLLAQLQKWTVRRQGTVHCWSPFTSLSPAVCLHPALWMVDQASSITFRYLSGFLRRCQIMWLGDRGTCMWTICPQLLRSRAWLVIEPATSISNPTPYRCARYILYAGGSIVGVSCRQSTTLTLTTLVAQCKLNGR